jgi:hypothetical protein
MSKKLSALRLAVLPCNSLDEYHSAWQWLYDNDVELQQADIDYLDKLICDGNVIPREDYFSTIDT